MGMPWLHGDAARRCQLLPAAASKQQWQADAHAARGIPLLSSTYPAAAGVLSSFPLLRSEVQLGQPAGNPRGLAAQGNLEPGAKFLNDSFIMMGKLNRNLGH